MEFLNEHRESLKVLHNFESEIRDLYPIQSNQKQLSAALFSKRLRGRLWIFRAPTK